MILTLTKVEQLFTKTGAEYRKITGTTPEGNETTKSVFDNLKFLWGLLIEGKEIELKLVKKGQFWNIINLKPADEPWPENTEAVKPAEVATPKVEVSKGSEAPPNPQAVGMMTKEIGDMIRAERLNGLFGHGTAVELIKWYRSQTLGITRVPFDGEKLPKFE